MKIALSGYGKMGHMVERVAAARGHETVARLDIDNNIDGAGITRERLNNADVAIDFSTPDAVVDNIRRYAELRLPVVVGTTGWYDRLDEVKSCVLGNGSALVYGANFSIGMNLFFRLVKQAGELFALYGEYDPYLIEHHHKFKKDAPSGTAIRMRLLLESSYTRDIPEALSVRAGYAPGTHELGFDSEADSIVLTHTARSREGFATGAIFAAERIVGRQGFFEFSELLFEGENQK